MYAQVVRMFSFFASLQKLQEIESKTDHRRLSEKCKAMRKYMVRIFWRSVFSTLSFGAVPPVTSPPHETCIFSNFNLANSTSEPDGSKEAYARPNRTDLQKPMHVRTGRIQRSLCTSEPDGSKKAYARPNHGSILHLYIYIYTHTQFVLQPLRC